MRFPEDIDGPAAADRWLQRTGLRWVKKDGNRAKLVKHACRAAAKLRDSVRLAVAARRVDWSVAWEDEPPEIERAAPVWVLGQILRLVAELDAGHEIDDETAAQHREFLNGADAIVAVDPIEDKVEAEQELRGERAVDRRIHGPAPVPRFSPGAPCIRA